MTTISQLLPLSTCQVHVLFHKTLLEAGLSPGLEGAKQLFGVRTMVLKVLHTQENLCVVRGVIKGASGLFFQTVFTAWSLFRQTYNTTDL